MNLSDIIGKASTPTHEFEQPFSTVFEANLQLNDFVSVNNKKRGNLRYLGKVHFKTGIFGGIELINAEGKHDGQLEGVRYVLDVHNLFLKISLKKFLKNKCQIEY